MLSSSFLTAATLIDSDIKGRKRRKLLQEIEDAKDELEALDASQNRRLAALSTDCDDIKELALHEQCTWDDVIKWARDEKRIRHALGFEDWKGIPLSILEGFSTAQLRKVFLNNANLRKLLDGVYPRADTTPSWSVKKQKLIEWSSAKLAYHFTQEVYAFNILYGLDNVSDGTEKTYLPLLADIVQANKMISKLQKLPSDSADIERALSPPAPRYVLNHRCNKMGAAILDSSLDEVFQFCRTQGKSLQYLITNICRLLLASNVPPTVGTYILLAKKFDELGEHRLVQLILDAIQECKFRLDEEALTFCLDYYAKTHNLKGFQQLESRMHGCGSGLTSVPAGQSPGPMIPGIAFDKYRFDQRKMRSSSKCSNYKKFSASRNELSALKYRSARKGQGVYASLIRGSLKFADDMNAMCHYIDLIREGHEPTVEMLTAILSRCYDQQDWRSCLRVLFKIQTIAGASLQTCRWILQLCQKRQDIKGFKKALRHGIHNGIISPAAENFSEQIEAMDADLLLKLAEECDELSQEAKDQEASFEPLESLARRLGVIVDQMAETAFEFGSMTLSYGLSPTKGFFLYTRITYRSADFSRWVARERNRVSSISNDVLDVSSNFPDSMANAISCSQEASGKVEPVGRLKANSSIKSYISPRPQRNLASLWYPLLRVLVDEIRKLRRLLVKLALEFGDIEISIRHGPTFGHMLHAKMLPLRDEFLDSIKGIEQKSSRLVHNWMKEDHGAVPVPRNSTIETTRPEESAYQERLPEDDRHLLEFEPDERCHNGTQWKVPDFGKALNKVNEEQKFPPGLKGILPGAVQIENILHI